MLQRVLSLAAVLSLLVIVVACGGGSGGPSPQATSGLLVAAPEPAVQPIPVYDDFHGAATASLEERICLADVIVRATLESTGDGELRFRAVEYLKGSGATTFTVRADTAGRNARWDGREAVLFLDRGSGGNQPRSTDAASFAFADTTALGDYMWNYAASTYAGSLSTGDSIDRRNPVWLPAASATSPPGKAKGGGGTRTSHDFVTDTQNPLGVANPTVSLEDLRAKITWVTTGDGVAGYDQCIRSSLYRIRYLRDMETYEGEPFWPREPSERQIASGAPQGTVLWRSTYTWDKYDKRWLEGQDAALFRSLRTDDNNDPADGWAFTLDTARPLPAGTYTFDSQLQPSALIPCDFTWAHNRLPWEVTVTAPEGTAHEALFDPASLTTGDGFDGTAGTLEPAGFSIGGTASTITGLKWRDGAVGLTLAPYVSLADHHLDFIALDGTLAHTVSVGDATRDSDTLSWPVDANPWPAGDQIMLRVYRKVASTCTVSEGGMKPGACYEKPAFRSSSYAFTLAEDAKVSRNVGAVSATVSGGGRPSYSIAGDGADHFSITDRGGHPHGGPARPRDDA